MKEVGRFKPKGQMRYSAAHCFFPAAIVIIILGLAGGAHAQNQTQAATTDPDEARALNSIFQKWKLPAQTSDWNISGELCTGRAIDNTSFNDSNYNPFIKCNCSFNNNSICHITHLKVSDKGVSDTIPDELWNLTYLINLNLENNMLKGPLSPSIGNLTQMQYLSLSINAFSGEIPKELGRLSNLLSLNFKVNNFSGSLPSELGNLTKLEQLYIDSAGVSGPFPSTFASLQKLNTLSASDNELTGPIPDFIGSWTQLTQLSLVGNSFDGPIPSSLSALISLTDLRIGGVLNGSSSLAFIQDMRNLTILMLRNNNISGSIPSTIGNYLRLVQLDLSFNNLYGQIPASLFNLNSLSFLFLGNNSLNGTLPVQKSSSLVNIDLSYNFLTGNFPSWISSQNGLNLNLVGNNFTINASSSNLPLGLNCLQRNFPCRSETSLHSDFAIKCGGDVMKSYNGVTYERDNSNLGPATYYMSDSQRWAVSNSGYFTDENITSYIFTSQSQFLNTIDSGLYQTARISASSLRYYGLGLQNGNYTVSLQFAESAITNSDWRSLGRRVFDIYIQGKIVAKDFDIRKEAGGVSLRAVVKDFNVSVRDNYIEIHLFWAGKGTCCVPDPGTYGPMISAISTTSNFNTVINNPSATNKKNQTGLIVGVVIGVATVIFLAAFLVFYLVRRKKIRRAYEDDELLGIDTRPYTFSYAELRAATNEFSPVNKLGEGGFGPVFKGTLDDGRVIAVKQLSLTSHQGRDQFMAEIATISAVQHRNLVKLYGCCIESDKRLLVYEYLENKSLDQALFGQRSLNLDWPTRYEICLGIARGLAYLHEESRLRIVHRDVKASNILLDFNLTPKLSDFGLAKLYDDKKTHISTRIAGTIGYLAPEYAMRGHLTEKADVFAFGVVALEVLSGRPNSDQSLRKDEAYLLEWAWNLHEKNREIELIDPRLSDFNEEEVKRMVVISLLCTQTSPRMRPAMSRVVSMLVGDIEVSSVTTRPGYFTDWNYTDETTAMGTRSSSMKAERNVNQNTPLSSTTSSTTAYVSSGSSQFMNEIMAVGR